MTAAHDFGLPAGLRAADDALLEEVDRTMSAGYRRAGRHALCRRGCTACCIGAFDITALDAARLARGLATLRRERPARAAAIEARAAAQWKGMQPHFPGDSATGALERDDVGRESFFAKYSSVPCPALSPRSGSCDLYAFRPLSCRTFGLPVRIGTEQLAPCALNFAGATPGEIAACTVAPDADDREAGLLDAAARLGLDASDTTVTAVVAISAVREA